MRHDGRLPGGKNNAASVISTDGAAEYMQYRTNFSSYSSCSVHGHSKDLLQHEHGQGKIRGGKHKGKSDKRITESKARQKEALYCAQT
jgi:hypothetical protein